jgi:hypothetical protein
MNWLSAECAAPESEIVVDQEPAKTVCLEPMVKMRLVRIGSNNFLS